MSLRIDVVEAGETRRLSAHFDHTITGSFNDLCCINFQRDPTISNVDNHRFSSLTRLNETSHCDSSSNISIHLPHISRLVLLSALARLVCRRLCHFENSGHVSTGQIRALGRKDLVMAEGVSETRPCCCCSLYSRLGQTTNLMN